MPFLRSSGQPMAALDDEIVLATPGVHPYLAETDTASRGASEGARGPVSNEISMRRDEILPLPADGTLSTSMDKRSHTFHWRTTMTSTRLYPNSMRLLGATLLFVVLSNTNATAATPVCDLTGASPTAECRTLIDRVLAEAPVVSTPSELEEEDSSIAVKAPREASENTSGLHVSNTGLGALARALVHPTGAWKVVLPVPSDQVG